MIIAKHLLLTTLSSEPLNSPTNCNNHQLNYRVEVRLTKNNHSPRTNSSTTIVIKVLISPIVCSREIRIADCLSRITTKQSSEQDSESRRTAQFRGSLLWLDDVSRARLRLVSCVWRHRFHITARSPLRRQFQWQVQVDKMRVLVFVFALCAFAAAYPSKFILLVVFRKCRTLGLCDSIVLRYTIFGLWRRNILTKIQIYS